MKKTLLILLMIALGGSISIPLHAQRKRINNISKDQNQNSNDKHLKGFFNFKWEESTGKVWVEIDKLNTEFLYINSLATGVGSNDIGLDRGQFGQSRVVKFIKSGPKVLLIQPNYGYRAVSNNPEEARSVEEAFAQSVLWGFEGKTENGKLWVDATDFLLQDAHQVASTLDRSGQGSYHVDASRSAIYLPMTKNFPENTEFETTLTFVGKPKGNYVWSVVPSPDAITVRQHHSFVKLPDEGYEMREFDPRSGFMFISYQDYATPIDQPLVKRFIERHRLKKKNPEASVSEAVEPIVYYLDRGAPEPIRSALLEGARWWNQAFEAAGYKNAFQVKILPEHADPMDVRYNLIQWVHRSTRGWSYGHSITDLRTGEIIKGHISLGSLRVRQDFLIAQGLLSPYLDDQNVSQEMEKLALARLHQLSAHEVGHTLGLMHNYASSQNQRASVMDYPHPLIKINDKGELDFSEAYDTEIGEWDKRAIKYGYSEFTNGTNEKERLAAILEESNKMGLQYISDRDARPTGGAHPTAHLWDNGTNAVEELEHIMQVRKIALDRFGLNSIPKGEPLASLEDVLVPIYLLHRYQTEAVSKLVGGVNYTYATKGDGQLITEIISGQEQEKALEILTNTLQPGFLAIPEQILELIPPKPHGYSRGRENFDSRTGLVFDPLAAASSSAEITVNLLLNPQRASRIVEFKSRKPELPGLQQVIDELIKVSWERKESNPQYAEINRLVSHMILEKLFKLAENKQTVAQARAITLLKINELEQWLNGQIKNQQDPDMLAHYTLALEDIARFKKSPEVYQTAENLDIPMGSPIGMSCEW
ncbi:zinc-dependent metalloprotease [Xanthovirga aplysinae]|uniref:zinc-dependent metalloprotease n=1 Tax=Xanthovirga aplysinae TaxID=2529853 RepID=UPI0012BD3030|nr:zinc-dependent metalloprotease [Xanthovirga aplysinae]MTI33215.1 DUF5117 domain-containing protein [Xanthovirga aplysinae]